MHYDMTTKMAAIAEKAYYYIQNRVLSGWELKSEYLILYR